MELIWKFNMMDHFIIFWIFFFILWEIHHIFIQKFKIISVWILSLINVKVFTFLFNVGLPTLLTLVILNTLSQVWVYSQYSPSSDSSFHPHTCVPPLTLFNGTPPTCGEYFRYKWVGHSSNQMLILGQFGSSTR